MVGGVIKTPAVGAGVCCLPVVLRQVMEGVAYLTAKFLSRDPETVLTQLPAVDSLAGVSQVVVGAAVAALELPVPPLGVGPVLLGVRALVDQVVEGEALVALILLAEGVPGVAPVLLAVRTVLQGVVKLAAELTPPLSPHLRLDRRNDRADTSC